MDERFVVRRWTERFPLAEQGEHRPWMSGSLSGGGRSGSHWRSAWWTSRSAASVSLVSSASLSGPRPPRDRPRDCPAHPVSMGPRPEVGPSPPEQVAFDSPSVGLVRKIAFYVHPRQPPPYLNLRFALTSVQMEQAPCQTPYPRIQSLHLPKFSTPSSVPSRSTLDMGVERGSIEEI